MPRRAGAAGGPTGPGAGIGRPSPAAGGAATDGAAQGGAAGGAADERAAPGTVRASRASLWLRRRARPAAGIVAALCGWALLIQTGILDRRQFPTIQAIVAALYTSRGALLSSLGATLESLFIGLLMASAAGAALGVAVGMSVWADAATDVIVRMMRPLPSLALIPIAILLAGLGVAMTAGLVAFAAFWPVFINTRYATRQVEPQLLDVGHALGFGRWELAWRVIAPSVAPAVATGIRVAAAMATVVTISVELVAGTGGLGGYVLDAEQGGATAQMYAGIVAGGIVGWLISNGTGALARLALPWDAAAASRAVPS